VSSKAFGKSLLFPIIFFAFGTACSSNLSASKPIFSKVPESANAKLAGTTPLQKNLPGDWACTGPTDGNGTCTLQKLSFNSDLTQVSIQDLWSFCEVKTDYSLSIDPEKADGEIDFTVHSSGLGQLVDGSESRSDCQAFFQTMDNKPWDENYSLTHNSDWTQITIDEMIFKKNPSPTPSASPSSV
jgi:hypothetical protein